MSFFAPGITNEIIDALIGATMSVIHLGLFPTVVAYFAITYITAKSGASEAASFLYLTPAASFIIAWVCLREIPAIMTIAGGVITLIGVSQTYFKGREKMEHTVLKIKG